MAKRGLPTTEEALKESGLLPMMIEYWKKQSLEFAARNALVEGASLEFVQKITGLDIETIKQLI